MNQYPENANGDELDRQIRAALQVETLPQQAARLEGFWHRRSRAQRQRRRVAATLVLAVAILVTVTVSLRFYGPDLRRGLAPSDNLHPVAPRVAAVDLLHATPPPVTVPSSQNEQPGTMARTPTAYERFVFVARSPRTANRRTVVTGVARMIDCLTSQEEMDVEELSRGCDLAPSAMEEELLRRLARSKDGETRAILRLLAVCGTSRSVSQLLRFAERSELRHETLAIIERIVGTAGLPDMARLSPDSLVRMAIYRRLLTAGDETSLRIYLGLIYERTATSEALGVADDVSPPVLTRLLERLDDEDAEVRLAAALVLGRANGPVVTRELIRRVTGPVPLTGIRETWIALLVCRDKQADMFLAYAARQPKLLGPLYRTRTWWETRMPLWYVVAING